MHCSNLRKVKILLEAFERAKRNINYYALDLSKPELERTLSVVSGIFKHVHCYGLLGTYDDGLAWLKRSENIEKPKSILWMGSSIGNLNRIDAAEFLKTYSTILRANDSIIIGVDACQDPEKVFNAYNEKEGKTHEFVLNGLLHANKLMGKEAFNLKDWRVIGQYNSESGCHQAFYSPTSDVHIEGSLIKAGEKIRVEESHKYSSRESSLLWEAAGLVLRAKYGDRYDEYREFHPDSKFAQKRAKMHNMPERLASCGH